MSPEDMGMGWLEITTWAQGAEVWAEEVARVREDAKRSAQMRAQIQQAGQQQKQFAQLLILLLQRVTDEQLIRHIFRQLVDEKLPIPAIFAQFFPRIHDKVQMSVKEWPFAVLVPAAQQMAWWIEGVVQWFRLVHTQFPILMGYSQKVAIVVDTLIAYQLIQKALLTDEQYQELIALVQSEIW